MSLLCAMGVIYLQPTDVLLLKCLLLQKKRKKKGKKKEFPCLSQEH